MKLNHTRRPRLAGVALTSSAIPILFSLLASAPAAADSGKTFSVDCGKGQTIGVAISQAEPGDVVEAAGICNENVVVSTNGVTLRAAPTGAVIVGPDSQIPAVTVQGRFVTVQGFMSISGGSSGIVVRHSGSATVSGNTIENTSRNGVSVAESSNAEISDNVIQNTGRTGIVVTDSSSADILDNSIAGNARDGITVSGASKVEISGNSITGNDRFGAFLSTSRADLLGPNTITDNAASAIQCNLFSAMRTTAAQTIVGVVVKVPGQCASGGDFPL